MSRFPTRYRVAMGLALAQLGLMSLGASYLGYDWLGKLSPAARYYAELSGAGNSYGFFAPGVHDQLGATFTAIDRNGVAREVPLDSGQGGEVRLRVGDIIDQFEEDAFDSVELQRSLSASLAGTVFGRHPETREVIVELKTYSPVSMADYRAGRRADWKPVYHAKFALNRDLGVAR